MVYNVRAMKHLKVAEARAQFGEMLDRAEQGEPVVIERKGVRFVLRAERDEPPPKSGRPFFTQVDPDVLSGEWTWAATRGGLAFQARRKR